MQGPWVSFGKATQGRESRFPSDGLGRDSCHPSQVHGSSPIMLGWLLTHLPHAILGRLKVRTGFFKCHSLPGLLKRLKLFFLISDHLRRFLVFLAWALGSCPLLSPSDELSAWDHFVIESSCTLWCGGSPNHLCCPWQSTQETAWASDWPFASGICHLLPG